MSPPDAPRPPAGTEGRGSDHPARAIEVNGSAAPATVHRIHPDNTHPLHAVLRGIEISLDTIAEHLRQSNEVTGELVDNVHRGRFDGSFSTDADEWAKAFDRSMTRIDRGLPQGPTDVGIVEVITLTEPIAAKGGGHVIAWGFASDGEVYPYVMRPDHPTPLICFEDVL